MAIFRIEDLRVDTVIGVYDWERDLRQRLLVSMEIYYDVRKAAQTDCLADTMDYDTLARAIRARAENQSFQLIESLAMDVLAEVMSRPGVTRATINVCKPGAIKDAEYVEVEVDSDMDWPPAPSSP